MSNIRNNIGFWGKAILLPSLIFVLSLSVLAPQKAHAQSIGSAAASGVASGLASCATQIGGTIAGSAVGSFAATKIASVADVTSVPVGDAGTQSANLTNNIVRTAREGCLDAIAYNIAKEVLNQLADATLTWVESGFTQFGQEGNKAFVGNVDNFLSNVGQQTFNRFMNEVTAENSPLRDVCSAFSQDILEQVGQDYFEENQAPAGMAWDADLLPDEGDLQDATANCDFGNLDAGSMQAFLDGDFQEGGWKAYRSMVENPESNPVGAYMENKQELKQRIQQARNTNLTELSNNGGWMSEVACPGEGSLNPNTNSCTGSDGKTLSEPAIRTPGNVVNEVINNTVNSDQRRLELADEVNEIVGALADQLVSQVIGGGTGGGGSDSTKGLFSAAAQEKSDALGNFSEAAEGDYGNQLKEEYVRKTLDDQITLEQDLLTIAKDLPDTNDVAETRVRINQCLESNRFNDERAETVEQKLNEMMNAYTSAFPTAESTGEKEVGPQRINWVGNDLDNWNYGESQGLESCDSYRDAYNFSYIPQRSTQSWEAFVCIPKFDGGSDGVGKFNETASFEGKFVNFTNEDALNTDNGNGALSDYLDIGKETQSGITKRPLYRDSRNNQVKIDWKGDDLEWEHYDPLAGKLANIITDQIYKGNNHTSKVFWPKVLSQDPNSATFRLPGRYIQESEAERLSQVANTVGDVNRYGNKTCDNRAYETNARSYIVKPHQDVWTIQECQRYNIGFEAASGPEIIGGGLGGLIGSLIGGPAGTIAGIVAGNIEDKDVAFALYRFADIPMSEYENITEDGEKPDAFREIQGAVDNKGQFISEIENLLGSTSTTPIDDRFTSPEFQSDNLREIQYDLDNVATSGTPQQVISERQQTINNRFGRIEKRFHTEDDLSSASDALSVVNPNSPDSVFNELRDTANANSCPTPAGWQPPVGSTPTPPTSTPPTQDRPEITDFTVARSGSNNRFITISWSASADQCTAKNDSELAQWSGPVSIGGSRIVRYESAINVSLSCSRNGQEDTASQPIPPAQPSPFEDIRNPRLE